VGSGYGTAPAPELVGREGLVVAVDLDAATLGFARENLDRAGYPSPPSPRTKTTSLYAVGSAPFLNCTLDVPARVRLLCRHRERQVARLPDVPLRAGATTHGPAGPHRRPLIFASSTAILSGAYEQAGGTHFILSIPELAWRAACGGHRPWGAVTLATKLGRRTGRHAHGPRDRDNASIDAVRRCRLNMGPPIPGT
jgi:hypothetical protein